MLTTGKLGTGRAGNLRLKLRLKSLCPLRNQSAFGEFRDVKIVLTRQ
jgi:hypothetical protein